MSEKLTKTSGTTDSVQIGLGHAREVEVDDDIDGLDVNTTGEEIGTHQIAAQALTKPLLVLYTQEVVLVPCGSRGRRGYDVPGSFAREYRSTSSRDP